jgi:hypothetical protein
VKDLTVSELKESVEQTVEQRLLELLGDPDEGLDLQEEVKTRLRRSLARERKNLKETRRRFGDALCNQVL